MKTLCAALLSLFLFMPISHAEDLYHTIYNEVASYNGDATQDDWITNTLLYASEVYSVDPLLITSVMEVESNFCCNAYSPVGAIGLMQLMPSTAQSLGVDPYDPLSNIVGGTVYLRQQMDSFA